MEILFADFLQGIFSIIYALITTIIGIKISSKYFKYRERNLLLVGIAWIGMGFVYFAISLRFLAYLTFRILIIDEICFALINPIVILPLLCWVAAMTELLSLKKKQRRIILIIYIIISIFYEIMTFYFLFTDYKYIGKFVGLLRVEWAIFSIITFTFFMGTILISGILFALKCLIAEKAEIKFQGKILLTAFTSYFIYGVLDLLLPITSVGLIISRSLLVSSALEFYLGFMLPEWLKKRINKID